MSIVNYGNDYKYANSRLSDTVVMNCKGKPVYVSNVNNDGYVVNRCITLENGWAEDHLDTIDLKSPKLGFVNLPSVTTFCSRKPTRHYKQGLNSSNMSYGTTPFKLTSKYLYNTILGNYPKVMDCAEEVFCGECYSKAFSRYFCLIKDGKDNKNIKLKYKNNIVGSVFINTDVDIFNFHLDEEFSFLQEVLEENVNV